MRSIDNILHAVSDALAERIDLRRLAVTAWRAPTVTKLDAAIVRAFGYNDLAVDDLIPTAIVGTTTAIVGDHIRDHRQLINREDMQECEDEYLDLLFRASDGNSENFLPDLRAKIRTAIRLSVLARLDGIMFEKSLRRNKTELSFALAVARYYRDYKQQCGLMDRADMLAAELEPVESCALCLISRRLPSLALQALRRLLPKAFFCTVAVDSR